LELHTLHCVPERMSPGEHIIDNVLHCPVELHVLPELHEPHSTDVPQIVCIPHWKFFDTQVSEHIVEHCPLIQVSFTPQLDTYAEP
jgi:hypothetical protein